MGDHLDFDEDGLAGHVGLNTVASALGLRIHPRVPDFIHAGEVFLPLNLLQQEPEVRAASKGPLSGREMTVLQLLGDGNKNKQIATALGLSEGTVKMHVMSICKKLKATNRTHAVVLARDTGLL